MIHLLPPSGPGDYDYALLTYVFPNPSPANTQLCDTVTINDDSIAEPCEDFYLNLTSSAERSCILGDDVPDIVTIRDDEGITHTHTLSSPQTYLVTDSPLLIGCLHYCSPLLGSLQQM